MQRKKNRRKIDVDDELKSIRVSTCDFFVSAQIAYCDAG